MRGIGLVSIKLWNFLRGYVIIKVEGLAIEKFLNLVMVNEVYIWDVERKNYTTLTAKVSTKAFKEVLQYAKKTGCRVFIVSKKGLPFVIFRLRKRKGIVLGFLLSVLLVYLFSTFIWEIDIKTVNGLKEEEVAKKLSEMGLKSGVSKFKIDINKLEKEFLLNNEEVAWIGINVRGTKAFVKVVGKTKPQKVLSKEEPCNIIAKRDGIIYKMTVLEGEAVKKVGDTVKTGDILISGIIEKPGLDTMFVHADGEVLARTWYEISVEEELKRTRCVKTGEKIVATKIIIGSNTITFTPRKIEFEKFEKEEKNLIPYEAPFKIVKEVYYEVKPEVETVPIKEAKEKGRKKALEELEKVISPGGKVVNKKEKYEVIDGRILRVTVMAEVLEDIGVKEKISYTGGEGKKID